MFSVRRFATIELVIFFSSSIKKIAADAATARRCRSIGDASIVQEPPS
jgi:hypothetical protein|tara:strand:+ start:364 stop:507 length:144 start_codon:yes stop_codon:yes gene_type:complete